MKLSVRKGQNSSRSFQCMNLNQLEDGETRDDFVKRNKDDCHWTFLMLSMGLFLCITTSLIMITEISSFALTYQNRNLLIAIYDEQLNISETSTSLLPTTTTQNSAPTFSTPVEISESTVDTTEAVTETTSQQLLSSSPSDTSVPDNIVTPTETRDPLSSTSKPLPECFLQGNPICILEHLHNPPKEYKCIQSCKYPPIVTARLNISLSALKDNFAVFTAQVATKNHKVAKRKTAYMGLVTLYKDDVENSNVETEWWKDIPDCKVIGNATWGSCE